MKRLLRLCLIFLLCSCLLASCSNKGSVNSKTEVYVFIASSLSNAMNEIAQKYQEMNPEVRIIYNTDSSGILATQIQEGAECDVFFSAAMKQMEELDQAGFIQSDTIVKLLENKIVLIKSKNLDTEVTGFDNVMLARDLALAGEEVPVGGYAREIFRNMGILDEVMEMEINECANVTAVLASVSEASNEIGITYATDACVQIDSVDVIAEAPSEYLTTPVIYPLGLVKNESANDKQTKAAQDFMEYLQSVDVSEIYVKYLFSIYQN